MAGTIVLGLIAAGVFGAYRLYTGWTSGCIRVRYGTDCWINEPWEYGFSFGMACFGVCAFGTAAFILFILWSEDA